ncbi:MAG: tRNA preQ1(34) S-adenosylmethionine ribosyltransferase-isomerase QueA [Thermodesulfovibrionales bacterium]|nr:tRNA preQ1(34) S-adenosylmethionine ribosyltransferase-isomerase QueA [Thermodesulfovibrionales bacterium]
MVRPIKRYLQSFIQELFYNPVNLMLIDDFNFNLPKNLIASRPIKDRDHSKLLVLHRDGKIEHRFFFNIIEYLNSGDLLIINDTKVFPARISGKKPSGGCLDILLIKNAHRDNIWEVLYRGKYEGEIHLFDDRKGFVWIENSEDTCKKKKFLKFIDIHAEEINQLIWQYGNMPLPKYVGRAPDREDIYSYQTVYAKKVGSIAAPTAGLHFTESLLKNIEQKGVLIRTVTLHIGVGTFKPIRVKTIQEHEMDAEFFEIETSLIEEIKKVKDGGKRVVAVGTTSTRAIEGYLSGNYVKFDNLSKDLSGKVCGYTNIFIYPGYKFIGVEGLITNFHLPRSTPLLLVCALAGKDRIFKAYEEAISLNYRFFSYGDAMLIL